MHVKSGRHVVANLMQNDGGNILEEHNLFSHNAQKY